ncbi:MAG: hypothetical protein QOG06_1503 [Gaiellaceae bacterium]|nr:hypothetical protein [Gaiellaceae bacterium]
MSEQPSRAETAAFYRDFSVQVGADDWRRDNGRHLRIRVELARLLGSSRDLRILDIGCGAGVLTSELCRYGEVLGTDLSGPAIDLASRLEPRATFLAGQFQELELGTGFDVITLFDVLEHVPTQERADLFARIDSMLGPRGCLILTTPHPGYTRWLREHQPDLLQIVDEAVEPHDVAALAEVHGLELVDYRAYDVDRPGARQYQLFAFSRAGTVIAAGRPLRRLQARLGTLPVSPLPRARRFAHALRLMRAGRRDVARWLLGAGTPPPGQSER